MNLELSHLVAFALIGLAAGWLAGWLMKTRRLGWIGNLVLGVIGSFVGGILFGLLGISAAGIVGNIIAATVGAVVLLWGLRYFRRI